MLDKLDREILQQLEFDSRQSNASIARKTKSNKVLVNYRIERLEKNGIISGYSYVSNQIILGKISFGLLIKFNDILFEEVEQLIKKMKSIPQVSWVKAIDGRWDIIVVIIEKDITSFSIVLEKFFSICGSHIKEYNFYIDYEGEVFGHDYLYDNPKRSSLKYGSGKSPDLKEDEVDVFESLKKSPRASLLEIANKLHRTYDTIKSKYVRLISEGVLLGCVPILNIKLLGYSEYLCLFNTATSQDQLKQLIKYCSENNQIIRYSKCLGHFNLILNIHCKNSLELKKTLYEIRSKFPNLINSYEIISFD